MTVKVILGIDPGLQHTGWGVIRVEGNRLSFVASGVISPDKSGPLERRLLVLHDTLTEIIAQYSPACSAIEETFVNVNERSSLKLGHARGAIMLTIARAHVPITEYAATLVKKTIVGVGRADKHQVMVMVKHLLPGCKVAQSDEADALAVAICHANHASFPLK